MARGGARRGAIGANYQNRTDLHQPAKAPPDGEYGSVKASLDAQKVIPLPTANGVGSAPPASPAPGAGPTISPGDLNFTGPTERPNEPVTAGLPVGPGPGPEVLNLPVASPNDPATVLRSIYQNVPQAQNNDVLRLIEAMDKSAV